LAKTGAVKRTASRPAATKLKALHTRVRAYYRRHRRDLPWRRTSDPYRILVSEVMLQQTQVDRVIPKYAAFLARFPTIAHLSRARFAQVARVWVGLGYNGRALRLWRCARAIASEHAGRVPRDPQVLMALPGIGPYTAAAVASFAFGRSVPVVDTNVRRVLVRALTGRDSASAAQVEQLARFALPLHGNAMWAQGLMDIGARFCRPAPRCDACPLRSACRFAKRGERRPVRAAATQPVRFVGSDRYYRGRIVRLLCAKPSVALCDLGRQVKERFDASDAAWLERIIERLARDGLVTIDRRRGRVRLA
jgi:A/G-specific adenine glycosylase